MRSFFWRTVISVTPCILAAWVTWVAVTKYFAGEPGGFKLGVDLVGGTILVYEIDVRKQAAAEAADPEKKSFDPQRDINILAEALKRRIDPNDLYNIIIRPAGGEGRVEIVLPTGGTYRAEKADKDWKELLAGIKDYYKISAEQEKKIEVPRGRVFELADSIQLIKAQNLWAEKLLNNEEAWNRMTKFGPTPPTADKKDPAYEAQKKKYDEQMAKWGKALVEKNNKDPKSAEFFFGEDLVRATVEVAGRLRPAPEVIEEIWAKEKPEDRIDRLIKVIDKALAPTPSATSENVVKLWIKNHAWHQMLVKAMEKWPWLKEFQEVDDTGSFYRYVIQRIPADNNEQLIGFIQSGGTFIGQAGLFALENIIGANPLEDYEQEEAKPDDKKESVRLEAYGPVKEFIEGLYGPSHRSIVREIQRRAREQGRGRDLTVEEVQRIKEQVARVGLLEFRILANDKDDAQGMDAAKQWLIEKQQELKDFAEKGLPPPGPPKSFQVSLARGQKSWITYSWVELSRQMRRDLSLDNAAKDDPSRAPIWKYAEGKVNDTFQLNDFRTSVRGALFFKRLSVDRNLTPEEREKKKYEYFVLARDPEFEQNAKGEILKDAKGQPVRTPRIDGNYLIHAEARPAQDFRPAVSFAFNAAGARLFGDITSKNVPDEAGGGYEETRKLRHLAIILDGEVMSAPTIQSTIRESGQITGNFTQKEIDSLVNTLRAGRLPATLKPEPVSESTMGPTLGQDTIRMGVIAVLMAFLAVLAFMVIYYRFAGLVASIALLMNLLLTVGFMVAVQATFTLPGLAGLVLTLGMAVDANILIYERVREERDRGANLGLAIRHGYERALPTIIDTHLSSIFTAIVLYVVGNDQLKGFGVSLTVGLIISLFTSLYMTRLMFDFWLAKGWLTKLSMMRFLTKPSIDFMAIRKPMFIVTISAGILGFALFFGRAPFNIDFVGGTAFGGQLTKGVSITELRKLVGEERQKEKLEVEVTEAPLTEDEGAPTPQKDEKDKDGKAKEAPAATARQSSGRYLLTYKVNPEPKPREVNLINPPDKPTAQERAEEVRLRASKLPDVTVEQQYRGATEAGKTPYFVIRTIEKEPDLVQAALDRLLRDEDGVSLLKRTYIDGDFQERIGHVTFYSQDPALFKGDKREELESKHAASGSPLLFRSLFTKELMKVLGTQEKNKLPDFEVRGEGSVNVDGGYPGLSIKFERKPENADAEEKIRTALNNTIASFNRYIQPDRLENFDSQLATETRYRALWAVLASWVAILVYLWFRFGSWTFGLAAVICLIHDLFITMGFVAIAHYLYGTSVGNILGLEDFKLDLPAVAALLTLMGYSVNDTIVVFDRIREVRGKNPDLTPKMINDSVNQTLSRTILANTTTFLVVLVLYIWGGPGVKLFAFIMVIGVIVGTYSSIYIASPLLLWFGEGNPDKEKGGVRQPVRPATEGAV